MRTALLNPMGLGLSEGPSPGPLVWTLLALMIQTYYDYENDISLIDKFRRQAS